ncbi:MAG: ribose 5-phosphate isomerase B [Deltaproteobacteria bacterium]|nr:ribose 5-phosphate isomerase B [Deltaproteobacteria bacterium]MBW2596205.1 ribose 5-phosphate isomerase B [Deltaproteobacteria bacterium]MBW2649708.1 ribose 5-phosphate isomerase B [Deltaproteobacteria bacterium]
MKIIIGSDHAGFDLKEALKESFDGMVDVGTYSEDSVDYPDFAARVARAVSSGEFERGILICGSGVGMSIVANKFSGIRAALCTDTDTARMSRMHNDANILVLAGRRTDVETAAAIVKVWLDTPFEGGRHKRRLDKIKNIEEENK